MYSDESTASDHHQENLEWVLGGWCDLYSARDVCTISVQNMIEHKYSQFDLVVTVVVVGGVT